MPTIKGFVNRNKLLVQGDSGTGKTGLIAFLANAGRKVVVIDAENNLNSAVNYCKDQAAADLITVFPIDRTLTTGSIIPDAWSAFQKGGVNGLPPLKDMTDEIIVLDTIGSIADAAEQDARNKNKSGWDVTNFAVDKLWETFYKLMLSTTYKPSVIALAHNRYIEKEGFPRRKVPITIGKSDASDFPKLFTDTWELIVGRDKKVTIHAAIDPETSRKKSHPDVPESFPYADFMKHYNLINPAKN